MTGTPVSWQEGNDLVVQMGGEEHLAQRVTTERRARGWSQETLARKMTEAGYPMVQGSVSKIEKPGPRRAISVDEAIGFANVFEVPLLDLLLPPNALADRELAQVVVDGPLLAQAAELGRRNLDDAVRTVVTAIETGGGPAAFVLSGLLEQRKRLLKNKPDGAPGLLFIRRVLREVDLEKVTGGGVDLPVWAVDRLVEEQGA